MGRTQFTTGVVSPKQLPRARHQISQLVELWEAWEGLGTPTHFRFRRLCELKLTKIPSDCACPRDFRSRDFRVFCVTG